jgi:hypothetical protein
MAFFCVWHLSVNDKIVAIYLKKSYLFEVIVLKNINQGRKKYNNCSHKFKLNPKRKEKRKKQLNPKINIMQTTSKM